MPIQKTHIASLGIAVILACAIPAFAQELQTLVTDPDQLLSAESLPAEEIENRYRIGIDCSPAPEVLRVHLRLIEDSGLLVNAVMDNSPANRGGIKRFDVIVEANGQPVSSVYDLVRAVNNSEGNDMNLALIREGEEKTVTVTPQERDEEEIRRLRRGFADRIGQAWPPGLGPDFWARAQAQIQRAIEEMQKFGPMNNNAWRRIGPGIVLDDHRALPDEFRLSMQVERSNNGPVKIKIQRGNDKWEITEDNLDELPDDIRPMVENMLNGNRTGIEGLLAPGFSNVLPPARPASPGSDKAKSDQRLQHRFDGLELRMQELQNAIRSIQADK